MAAITTFGTLKSEILALLGRAPADPAYQMVTADINRELRTLDMEATATLTSAGSYAMPAAFLEMIEAYIDETPRRFLTPTTAHAINTMWATSGKAHQYAIVGDGADGTMIFDKTTTDDVEIRYYTEVTALAADEDDNVVLLKHPGVYLYGALYHHARMIRDQAAAADWGADYKREMDAANAFAFRERMRGAPARVTPRVVM